MQQNRFARFVLLAIVGLMITGCAPGLQERFRALAPRRPAIAREPLLTESPPPVNRLLVKEADGNLYTMNAAGGERFALTTDASFVRVYSQPTWSPTGERLAWGAFDRQEAEITNSLTTTGYDGISRQSAEVPFAPFYISWSPGGEKLAYLSNWVVSEQPSLALRLAEVEGSGLSVRTLGAGEPLYFAWAPDGSQLLTHVSNERVELQRLDGSEQSLALSGALFSAPAWSPDGERLYYVIAGEQGQQLVEADANGAVLKKLTDFEESISFLLSPDGSRLAYMVTSREAPLATVGELYLLETETRRTRQLTDSPVVGFYWSPDGQKLAYLTLAPIGARIGLQWHVWDGAEITPYAAYFPSDLYLRAYLPFFTQYALSMSHWSPASDAFVYAGTNASGLAGVWVQELGNPAPARPVAGGTFAAWSPR